MSQCGVSIPLSDLVQAIIDNYGDSLVGEITRRIEINRANEPKQTTFKDITLKGNLVLDQDAVTSLCSNLQTCINDKIATYFGCERDNHVTAFAIDKEQQRLTLTLKFGETLHIDKAELQSWLKEAEQKAGGVKGGTLLDNRTTLQLVNQDDSTVDIDLSALVPNVTDKFLESATIDGNNLLTLQVSGQAPVTVDLSRYVNTPQQSVSVDLASVCQAYSTARLVNEFPDTYETLARVDGECVRISTTKPRLTDVRASASWASNAFSGSSTTFMGSVRNYHSKDAGSVLMTVQLPVADGVTYANPSTIAPTGITATQVTNNNGTLTYRIDNLKAGATVTVQVVVMFERQGTYNGSTQAGLETPEIYDINSGDDYATAQVVVSEYAQGNGTDLCPLVKAYVNGKEIPTYQNGSGLSVPNFPTHRAARYTRTGLQENGSYIVVPPGAVITFDQDCTYSVGYRAPSVAGEIYNTHHALIKIGGQWLPYTMLSAWGLPSNEHTGTSNSITLPNTPGVYAISFLTNINCPQQNFAVHILPEAGSYGGDTFEVTGGLPYEIIEDYRREGDDSKQDDYYITPDAPNNPVFVPVMPRSPLLNVQIRATIHRKLILKPKVGQTYTGRIKLSSELGARKLAITTTGGNLAVQIINDKEIQYTVSASSSVNDNHVNGLLDWQVQP